MGTHSKLQAENRLITPIDIQHLGKTAKYCQLQSDGSYLVKGTDLDDMELVVVIRISQDKLFIKTMW